MIWTKWLCLDILLYIYFNALVPFYNQLNNWCGLGQWCQAWKGLAITNRPCMIMISMWSKFERSWLVLWNIKWRWLSAKLHEHFHVLILTFFYLLVSKWTSHFVCRHFLNHIVLSSICGKFQGSLFLLSNECSTWLVFNWSKIKVQLVY